MPYIPLLSGWPDWIYFIVGVGATGLLWWKTDWWIKVVVSTVLFLGTSYAVQSAGMHMCYEGYPPEFLEYAFATVAALVPWGFWRRTWPVPPAFVLVFFSGTHIAGALAHSYHGADVTGNPDFSSSRFWHTPITGQYPRDPKKVEAFWEDLGVMSHGE